MAVEHDVTREDVAVILDCMMLHKETGEWMLITQDVKESLVWDKKNMQNFLKFILLWQSIQKACLSNWFYKKKESCNSGQTVTCFYSPRRHNW